MNKIQTLKKYDLHCHLDGSISPETIKKMAAGVGISLPAGEELKNQLMVQPDCQSLREYLMKFNLPLSCLVTKENFRLAVTDVIKQAAGENVVYMEIRFAPLLSVHKGEGGSFSCKDIIEGAIAGIEEGKRIFGVDSNLIICGMRHMPVAENVRLVETAREYLGAGVCAVDLAGDEAAFPLRLHREMFAMAKKLGMPYTIHAGECGSPESVRDALELGAARIGHGIAVRKDKELQKLCAERGIPLEMCPTSNLQTKAVNSLQDYPLLEFLEAGLKVTVNTDNRTVSDTSITKELKLLQDYYHLTVSDLEMLMCNAREAAFSMTVN